MRSCLKNEGLIAGSFRPPPDADFGCAPKLYCIPYWLKGGEGVNLNPICQQINPLQSFDSCSFKVGAENENGPLSHDHRPSINIVVVAIV